MIISMRVRSVAAAVGASILVGACGGYYVVPLNALLQKQGHVTVGSGSSIAQANF